jgi:hypothetical protein
MNIEFHSLYWDNINPHMLESHKRVMKHFNIDLKYHAENTEHGTWLDSVFEKSNADIVCIIEPDLLPLDKDAVNDIISFVSRNNTFVGIAQCFNRGQSINYIYAGPGFFVMPMAVYETLGKPSFRAPRRGDIAQGVSIAADEMNFRYRALMPTCFELEPRVGAWPLHCTGFYGIGTVYHNRFYHLFESRKTPYVDLFTKRCEEVISGTFSTAGFIDSNRFDY